METLDNGEQTIQHASRENLAGEYRYGDLGQIVLLLMFFAVWLGDAFFLHYTTFLSHYVPFWLRLLAALSILYTASYLARTSHDILFAKIRTNPGVIRTGVFGRVRHPLYLSAIVFYPGLLCLVFSLAATLVWIGIIGFYHVIARYEERLLLKKFGVDYEAYMREVPMWFPRLTANKRSTP